VDALFTFEVWLTSTRPIRVDEHRGWVVIADEDSAAGFRAAERDAIAMVSGSRPCEMVTRTRLVAVEL
jgi:acetolactate synthase regulatory subunit